MADGLRGVARAYYERATREERYEAKDFFTKLDVNGDGKISLEEFKTGFDSRASTEEFFNKLDSDSDGALDFSEVLVLFYHKKNAISISRCDGCNQRLFGPYFSCLMCLDNFPHTYDLCCDCHRGAKFKHHHPLKFMLHDEAALVKFVQTKTQPAKQTVEVEPSTSTAIVPAPGQTQSEMEELREIAKAHYAASSPEIQAVAKDFFNSMDSDGDRKVELSEFLSFMSERGYKLTGKADFFKKLDVDGNGTLDFWEVITLYYIIKSGRPFCDRCGEFIPAIFFTCVHCYKARSSFDLCLRCYQSADFNHDHDGRRAPFLDNYTLLQNNQGSDTNAIPAQIEFGIRTLELGVEISSIVCTIM